MNVYFKKDIKDLDIFYIKNRKHILFNDKNMQQDYESWCRICFYWGEPLDIINTPYTLKIRKLIKKINKSPYIDCYK